MLRHFNRKAVNTVRDFIGFLEFIVALLQALMPSEKAVIFPILVIDMVWIWIVTTAFSYLLLSRSTISNVTVAQIAADTVVRASM